MKNCYMLELADGTRLAICAEDEAAGEIVIFLSETARLSRAPEPLPPNISLLLVSAANRNRLKSYKEEIAACIMEERDTPRFRTRQSDDSPVEIVTRDEWFWRQLVRLSALIGSQTHSRGGVLLHSGLVRLPPHLNSNGSKAKTGILLAGCSGVGKTTAGARLPKPWHALSDDLTLVVRDEQGLYWAHPWPTWSRFIHEEIQSPLPSWDVQKAVRLQAIFFMIQGEDQVKPMGAGQALCLLTELSRQASDRILWDMTTEEMAGFNRRCFKNLCAVVQTVPGYLLHVSLDGSFWNKVEDVLDQ